MFDLNEQPTLPRYELKVVGGGVKSYDAILVSFDLRVLDGERDPTKIREVVNRIFEVDVDALSAMSILQNFVEFEEAHLEEPLKKVFGAELFSTTSTGSRPENTENSEQPNTSA